MKGQKIADEFFSASPRHRTKRRLIELIDQHDAIMDSQKAVHRRVQRRLMVLLTAGVPYDEAECIARETA